MSSTSKNLRLVSIALAYLFSLEIKTFSRFIDSMDISLAVAACLEESLSFHDDDDDDNDDDNNNDDEDKHKQDEDQEREQKIKAMFFMHALVSFGRNFRACKLV